MSIDNWYCNREILITGVTSELGRALLEKLLRSLPNVRIHTVLRSRNGFNKEDRIRRIFASPGYERLRQQEPNAVTRVKALEGNLLYENLGLSKEDTESLKNIEIVFHAGGPLEEVLEVCQRLPNLQSIAVASALSRYKGQVPESLLKEKIPKDLPLALVRLPALGPAYKEPMPGFVERLTGPTALIVGAGFVLGRSDLPAEIYPVDLSANALIVAAKEKGTRNRTDEPTVYNAPNLGCTWGALVQKGSLTSRKFSYPTFGLRGITSMSWLHWIVVLLLEWTPSYLCDRVLLFSSSKPRCVAHHEDIRKALRSLEAIASSSRPIERNRIYQLQKSLSSEDNETFAICPEIDVETYTLCATASARKYCVDESQIKIFKIFRRSIIALIVLLIGCYLL